MDKISLFHGQKLTISKFSWHIEYDFLKDYHKNNFHTNKTQYDWFPGKSQNSKKFHTKNQEDSQLRPEVIGQKLSKQSILDKNGQIFVLNGQNFAKSELSRHIEYGFLKEDHKNSFHTKNWEDSQRRLEVRGEKISNQSILAQK